MYKYYTNGEILNKLNKAIEDMDWEQVALLQEEADIRNI